MKLNKTLSQTLTGILTHYGMVLSQMDENTFEYLAPSDMAAALHLPEYGKLGFSYQTTGQEIVPALHDSELFKSIEKFLTDKGKIAKASYPAVTVNPAKLSKIISQTTGFSNATFRMKEEETKTISYLLICFKYRALSDDKQEGILSILINALNFSTSFPEESLDVILENLQDSRENNFSSALYPKITRPFKAASLAAENAVKEKLKDFRKSSEKRLNRDIQRIYEYYETLQEETRKLIEKAQKNSEEDKSRLFGKLQAIQTEQKWKIQDIVSRYALKITVEPVALIWIETQTTLWGIEIRRRALSRSFALSYNPFFKRLDPLPCEGCFFPRGDYSICDDQLHILCSQCFKTCARCEKKYCAVCWHGICPKCTLKPHS